MRIVGVQVGVGGPWNAQSKSIKKNQKVSIFSCFFFNENKERRAEKIEGKEKDKKDDDVVDSNKKNI